MKSKLKRMLAIVLSAVMLTFTAPIINESAGITAAAAEQKWDSLYDTNKCSTVSVDKSTYHGTSGYSIKIANKKYNKAGIYRKFAVKKNTDYRISVWVKTTGLKNDPNKTGINPGAYIYFLTPDTPYYQWHNGKTWKKLEFIINSKSLTELDISLRNGSFQNYCKGTVWFSDFKIEEFAGKKTNEWNVLGVVFKNVNAPVVLDGKKQMYKDALNDDDVKSVTEAMNRMYTSIPLLSENKWKIKCIDVVATDAVIDELVKTGDDYCLSESKLKCVRNELDRLIEKEEKESGKKYNQIIIFAPLAGVAKNWLGLGGGYYKGAYVCQVKRASGADWSQNGKNNYIEATFVHEMLHSVERISKSIDPDNTERFHNYEKYGYVEGMEGWSKYAKWHSDYMRSETPSGKGVVPKAYDVYNTVTWKVIYGSKSEPAKTDIASLKISKPSNYYYSGTEKRPSITVKDGKKKLVKGKDYKLTYLNNTEIGLGAVIVEGMGKYTGKYAQTFRINPQKTDLTVNKSGSTYNFSWESVKGAEKYDLMYSTDSGKTFKCLRTIDGSKQSISVKLVSDKKYVFKIRAFKKLYPQKFYSKYSAVVKA